MQQRCDRLLTATLFYFVLAYACCVSTESIIAPLLQGFVVCCMPAHTVQAQRTQHLESQLSSMNAALRQAEANTKAAEGKAAEQATQAAAARAEVRAHIFRSCNTAVAGHVQPLLLAMHFVLAIDCDASQRTDRTVAEVGWAGLGWGRTCMKPGSVLHTAVYFTGSCSSGSWSNKQQQGGQRGYGAD
jgi:hypothetical protein